MDLKKVGKFIADNRKKKGYTQEKLGELLGISSNALSKWERGINAPDISLLSLLSETLDVTVDEILLGEKIDKSIEKKYISDNILSGIKYYNEKTKNKYFKILLYSILVFIVSILLLFLFENYNKFKIYRIESKDKNYSVNGYIIYNQERNIVVVNNIDIREKVIGTDEETRVKNIYLLLKYEDKIIFSYKEDIDEENNKLNNYLINNTFLADNEMYPKDNVLCKNIDLNKLKLIIMYTPIDNENKYDEKIEIPLKIVKLYSNDKIFY